MHEEQVRLESERLERKGTNRLIYGIQEHLKYPLILDYPGCVDVLLDEFGYEGSNSKGVVYITGHSKSYRPKIDGLNYLYVEFRVYRISAGVELEPILLPLLPESFLVTWYGHLVPIMGGLIDKLPSHLRPLLDKVLLARYFLYNFSELFAKLESPEELLGLVKDGLWFNIKDVAFPIWGDPLRLVNITLEKNGVCGSLDVPLFQEG